MKTLFLLWLLTLWVIPASGVELVIKAVDATNTTSVAKDATGCYKRGDIVEVRKDGAFWGTQVVIPPKDGGKFVRIRICKNDGTELLPSELRDIIRAKWPQILEAFSPEYNATNATTGELIVTRRRALNVSIDLFTAAQKNTLNNTGTLGFTENGQAAISLAAARTRIVNKLTGETP